MGELTPEQEEVFAKNPRFVGLKFPELTNPETIDRRYVGKLPKQALSLMNGFLKMDPKERLMGIEAMAHPYFDGVRDAECEGLVAVFR